MLNSSHKKRHSKVCDEWHSMNKEPHSGKMHSKIVCFAQPRKEKEQDWTKKLVVCFPRTRKFDLCCFHATSLFIHVYLVHLIKSQGKVSENKITSENCANRKWKQRSNWKHRTPLMCGEQHSVSGTKIFLDLVGNTGLCEQIRATQLLTGNSTTKRWNQIFLMEKKFKFELSTHQTSLRSDDKLDTDWFSARSTNKQPYFLIPNQVLLGLS